MSGDSWQPIATLGSVSDLPKYYPDVSAHLRVRVSVVTADGVVDMVEAHTFWEERGYLYMSAVNSPNMRSLTLAPGQWRSVTILATSEDSGQTWRAEHFPIIHDIAKILEPTTCPA